ncbi:hypothetical protein [Vibrio salinus]|uniref:hypothetical protein n=1 Tax=Vibrio salinus TaxID=2899784 RepID=UPI001E3CD9FB|nr:hypothetical protein [Vibrio salinus]MCE0496124.1 hypothetical protein [Vibrio salinus]
MFDSFFPKPKLFFFSFVFWSLLCVISWYTVVQGLGPKLSMASVFGIDYPDSLAANANQLAKMHFHELTENSDETHALYQYMACLLTAIFIGVWMIWGRAEMGQVVCVWLCSDCLYYLVSGRSECQAKRVVRRIL